LASPRPKPVTLPGGPGGCIVGSPKQGLYRTVHSQGLKDRMVYLRSRARFPLEVVALMSGSYRESKRQQDYLRRRFRDKEAGDGWLRLSAADLAEARVYLAREKERLEREADLERKAGRARQEEAARAKEQAARAQEKALDDGMRRLRTLAEHVRSCTEQELRSARAAWPRWQVTDECLPLIERFHAAAANFEAALSRKAMELQLARMPKDCGASSAL